MAYTTKISKSLIHRLKSFKYKNKCYICENIIDKDKRVIITTERCFVHNEEVLDAFNDFFYILTIEKLSFHIYCVRILGSIEYEKTRN